MNITQVQLPFLILSILLDVVASFMDYRSSENRYEGNWLVRGKDGTVSLLKYASLQSGIIAGVFIIGWFFRADSNVWWGVIVWNAGYAAAKFYVAHFHNPKVEKIVR